MANLRMNGKYRIAIKFGQKKLHPGETLYRETEMFEIQYFSKRWYRKNKWVTIAAGTTEKGQDNLYKFIPFHTYVEAENFLYQYYVEKNNTTKIDSHYEYEMEVFYF